VYLYGTEFLCFLGQLAQHSFFLFLFLFLFLYLLLQFRTQPHLGSCLASWYSIRILHACNLNIRLGSLEHNAEDLFANDCMVTQWARRLLEPIKKQFAFLSYSDLWTLAACVAIKNMGGELAFEVLHFMLGAAGAALLNAICSLLACCLHSMVGQARR
jgi:hypothetical protein